MNQQLAKSIENCFARFPHGGEFMPLDHTSPYKVISAEGDNLHLSDTFIAACGAEVPENFLIDLSPDEREVYTSLQPLIESLASEIGVNCMAILQRGEKMELKAIVSVLGAWR